MDKCTKFIGIDISKDVFDVPDYKDIHRQYENNIKGFKKFLKSMDSNDVCVMEATAYYHLRLAYFLFENHSKVIVFNPLSVKRFVQMRLSKIKTDKADSKMIRLYAENNSLPFWEAQNSIELEALQITRLLDIYTKQSTALKNKIHGEEILGKPSVFVLKSLSISLSFL
jgi:transposase